MIWDQLLSSWAWCLTSGAQNHTWPLNLHILVGHALGNCQNHGLVWLAGSSCWHHGCCQLDLGDWLASQSPNPSWQHRVSLKHLQNTAILCHCVSLLGMLCHLGGWDLVADTWSSSHRTCSELAKHQVILTIMVLVLLDRQILRILILKTKIYFMWGCHILGGLCQLEFWKGVATCWVVSVNLNFGRIVQERHEKSEQPHCPTSWD